MLTPPTIEERLAALEAKVAADGPGGWGGWFKAKVDPILTALQPALILAATAWLASLHFSTAKKVDDAAVVSKLAAAASDAAATNAAAAVERADANHADVAAKIEDVKAEVRRPQAAPAPPAPPRKEPAKTFLDRVREEMADKERE